MKRFKIWLVLQLLAVFASGAVVGALAYRYYEGRQEAQLLRERAKRAPSPVDFKQRFIQAMRDRLRLTDQQITQLDQIMEESRRRFEEARKRTDAEMREAMQAIQRDQQARIEAMLTEEQRAEYRKMLEERRIEMERRRKEREKLGPSPGSRP